MSIIANGSKMVENWQKQDQNALLEKPHPKKFPGQ